MPVGGTAFLGANQHPRITTTYLNQLNRHGDPAPGVPVSTAQASGSIVQPYDGFTGGKLTITGPWAKQFADPAVGPLYGGVFQYVQFDRLMTGPATPGATCFWLDEGRYIVTTIWNAATAFKPAGVIINAVYPGYWDFIQIAGIAMALFSPTATGTLGGGVVVVPSATLPSYANGGTPGLPNGLGIAVMTAPLASTASPVELNLNVGWNY